MICERGTFWIKSETDERRGQEEENQIEWRKINEVKADEDVLLVCSKVQERNKWKIYASQITFGVLTPEAMFAIEEVDNYI